VKPSKLYETLHALIGERVPLHIWSACGVGKSQIVAQVACDLDYDFLDVRAVQLDPVDLRGLPRIAENQTEWVPPKFLPTTGKGILHPPPEGLPPSSIQQGCCIRSTFLPPASAFMAHFGEAQPQGHRTFKSEIDFCP
jgi:hypothetical protein